MKIGEKIREARQALGLSQTELSAQIPMNQSSYSKIERGWQEPSIQQLRRICQILNINPQYLLSLGIYEDLTDDDVMFLRQLHKLYEKYYRK